MRQALLGKGAAADHMDAIDISMVSDPACAHMAGNGMHLASVGFAMLCAVLCVEKTVTGPNLFRTSFDLPCVASCVQCAASKIMG